MISTQLCAARVVRSSVRLGLLHLLDDLLRPRIGGFSEVPKSLKEKGREVAEGLSIAQTLESSLGYRSSTSD